MNIYKCFGGFLATFIIIDGIWISAAALPMYQNQVGDLLAAEPKLWAAVLFYLIYAAAGVHLAIKPAQSVRTAALNGAILGVVAYGTYAATNYAMLSGWTLTLFLTDTLWGAVLTAICAAAGYYFGKGQGQPKLNTH